MTNLMMTWQVSTAPDFSGIDSLFLTSILDWSPLRWHLAARELMDLSIIFSTIVVFPMCFFELGGVWSRFDYLLEYFHGICSRLYVHSRTSLNEQEPSKSQHWIHGQHSTARDKRIFASYSGSTSSSTAAFHKRTESGYWECVPTLSFTNKASKLRWNCLSLEEDSKESIDTWIVVS